MSELDPATEKMLERMCKNHMSEYNDWCMSALRDLLVRVREADAKMADKASLYGHIDGEICAREIATAIRSQTYADLLERS